MFSSGKQINNFNRYGIIVFYKFLEFVNTPIPYLLSLKYKPQKDETYSTLSINNPKIILTLLSISAIDFFQRNNTIS